MFHTNTKNGITYLTADTLSGVCHGFSTRTGGVSPAPWDSLNLGVGRGDELTRVQENYRRFCAALGTDVNRVVLSKQIHEDVVRHVTEEDIGKGLWRDRDYPSVDGMVTDVPHLPLVVFSADCNVVLLYDPVRRAIGACHAGWRGTVNYILGHTLDKMRARYGTEGKEVIACIGPGISLSAFEVGDEVYEAFRESGFPMDYISEWKPDTHKYHIDLWAANRLQLLDFGVPSAQVETANICTFSRYEEFFSARRLGIKSGRILSGIMLK